MTIYLDETEVSTEASESDFEKFTTSERVQQAAEILARDPAGPRLGRVVVVGNLESNLNGDEQAPSPSTPEEQIFVQGDICNTSVLRQFIRETGEKPPSSNKTGIEDLLMLDWETPDIGKVLSGVGGTYSFVMLKPGLQDQPGTLVVARAPLGIHNLYLARSEGGKDTPGKLIIGPDLKSVLGAETANVAQIAEFPAGHLYVGGKGISSFVSEISLEGAESPDFHARTAHREIFSGLVRAVRANLESGSGTRGVGLYLSGGLSSSLLGALVLRFARGLSTFTVGIADSPDLRYARYASQALDTNHHEQTFTLDEILEALPEIVWQAETFDRRHIRDGVVSYFSGRLASEHVSAALTGEGAATLFGDARTARFQSGLTHKGRKTATGSPHSDGRSGFEWQVALTDRLRTALACTVRIGRLHGIKIRTPYLSDSELVSYIAHTVESLEGTPMRGKKLLRDIARDFLPEPLIQRPHRSLSAGAGVGKVLQKYAADTISDSAFEAEREISPNILLQSKEDLLYFRLFRERFPVTQVLPLILGDL
ncbi:MAG: hypothetical protein OHK0029_19740 [Armatimonadaceae bacterium]